MMRSTPALTAVLAVLAVVGCGGGETEQVGGETASTTASATELERCPNTERNGKGSSPTAAAWGGSVHGISCAEAGRLIESHLIQGFQENVLIADGGQTQDQLETGKPGQFDVAGYRCHHEPLSNEGGWALRCEQGDQVVAFSFTP